MIRWIFIAGMFLPIGAVGFSMGAAFWQATAIGGSNVVGGGLALTVCTIIWGAATVKKSVESELGGIKKALAEMVTRDALELRLAQEELKNRNIFVARDDCETNHSIKAQLNGKAKGAGV